MERTIKSKIKRFASLLLAVATLVSVIPAALANPAYQFSDFPTGWSRPAMEAAIENGLLVGIGEDRIGPQKNLTRAEMAAVMVRAFGATTKANVSKFIDLDADSWYYDSIASAVKMGALAGISNTEMAPTDYITREQVFSILARILALSSNNAEVLSKFKDAGQISNWARSTVIPMVERGYVNGDDFGNINPKAYITREEFAQVMYMTIKKYITEAGTYEEDMDGIVVLRVGDITLKDAMISGDLVVGDGAAKDVVILEDMSIDGRLLTRGGTNKLVETTVSDGVVVLNPNGTTYFSNYRIETVFDDIIEHTKALFLTRAPGGVQVGEQITVNFYRGFGETAPIGSPVTLTLSGGVANVPSGQIPNIDAYFWDGNGFKKSDYMPGTYPIKNNEYKVAPSFWYQDGGEWKPFDETVMLSQSTNVYLMYREVSLSALGANIFARYDKNARFMDTAKVLAHQTYEKIKKAKDEGLPLYDTLNENVLGIFRGTNLIEEDNGKQYIKPFLFPLALSNALDKEDVDRVVKSRVETIISKIAEPGYIDKLLQWPAVQEYLPDGLTNDQIIDFVSGLDDDGKVALLEVVYSSNEYTDVIEAIENNDDFVITPENFKVYKEILKELETITFDTVMDMSNNNAMENFVAIVGDTACADIFDGRREVYCDELEALIDDVENGRTASATIPSAFTLIFDLIDDVLEPLYDRAETNIVNKFSASVRYSENPYLQYLVEDHDVISEMFGSDSGVPAGQEKVRTRYYLKDITEYAKYMVKLLIAIDDAFSVYGDDGELGLTDAQFEELFNAVFADIYDVHNKLDAIMQDFYYRDELPDIVEAALGSVQKLNDIFTQIKPTLKNIIGVYLDSTIYDDLSNGRPGENTKKIVEILTGREDVTFTVDSFYEALGNREESIKTMLNSIRDSGSITGIANLLKDTLGIREDLVDSLVNFINSVADNGLRHYRVPNPAGETTIDEYQVTFGGKTVILRRSFEG